MKSTYVAASISLMLIAGALFFTRGGEGTGAPPAQNVSIVDGQQIIEIQAKGGYTPRTSSAKAGIPTIIRFRTTGTFDCSSFIRIPSMGVSRSLPPSGTIDIAINNPQAGPLQGMCGMGMYPFVINFQS